MSAARDGRRMGGSMLHPDQINWLAVVAATIAHAAIGIIWYGPLFGEFWLRSLGKTREQLGQGGAAIAVSTIAAAVMAIAFALLLTTVGAAERTLVNGAIWGAVLGLGFVAATKLISSAFEGVTMTVGLLFGAYETVALIVMGGILGAIR
jgi:hypothetical protein